MSPEKLIPKQERTYTPPGFIDEETIKSLSPEKQQYWANRIVGNPGQGPKPKKAEIKKSGDAPTYFDDDGNMVVKNREARRTKPVTKPYFTKARHAMKLKRGQTQHG